MFTIYCEKDKTFFDFEKHQFVKEITKKCLAPTRKMAISGYGWSDYMPTEIVIELNDEMEIVKKYSFNIVEGFKEIV